MKLEKLHIFQELLVTQMNNLIFFPIAMLLATLFRAIVPATCPRLLIWMLGGLIPFGFYFARQKIKHFVPLVFFHTVGLGILFLLSFGISDGDISVNRVSFSLTGIGFMIYSIYLRLTTDDFKDNTLPMPVAVGIAAVSLYLQHYQDNAEWDSYHKIVLILVFVCYFLNYYIQEYINFLSVNASSTGILPEKEIFHSGIHLVILYTVLGSLFLIFTAQFSWFKSILSTIKNIVVKILRFIFSLFPVTGSDTSEIYIDQKVSGSGMPLPEPGEASMFWKVLEVIATITIVVAILLAICYGLKQFFAFVNKMMQKQAHKHPELESMSGHDVREKCEVKKRERNQSLRQNLKELLDARERIRRIYKKKISAFKGNLNSFSPERISFYTAREMEHYMEADSFAKIYEKARYSNEECTSQDVKRMKETCH